MSVPTERAGSSGSTGRVNNNAQGWGVAGAIVLLAILANAFIFMVHKRTYKHPTDPTNISGSSAAH